MRERLADFYNERFRIRLTFVRFGTKNGYRGYLIKTYLFSEVFRITDREPEQLTDHIWLSSSKQLDQLDLQPGDLIEFNARVRAYTKGYSEDSVENPKRIDFKFANISQAKKIQASLQRIEDRVAERIEAHNTRLHAHRQRLYSRPQVQSQKNTMDRFL